jgi:hypothetical protein
MTLAGRRPRGEAASILNAEKLAHYFGRLRIERFAKIEIQSKPVPPPGFAFRKWAPACRLTESEKWAARMKIHADTGFARFCANAEGPKGGGGAAALQLAYARSGR